MESKKHEIQLDNFILFNDNPRNRKLFDKLKPYITNHSSFLNLSGANFSEVTNHMVITGVSAESYLRAARINLK